MDERCRDEYILWRHYRVQYMFQSLLSFYYLWFNNKPHYKYTRTSSVVTALFGVALTPQSTMTTDATKERTSNMVTCVAI